MRKYQQLILLLVSCFSVGILLMYKNENNRLKYVLQAVNFFGRSDVAILRRTKDNGTVDIIPDFNFPLPTFQMIGDSFHAYSAYWGRNELVAGGEAVVLVVGKSDAIVNFQCNLIYERGTKTIPGKFRFQRGFNETAAYNKKTSEFTSYIFFCRITRDFGRPEKVTFTDRRTSVGFTTTKLRLRHLKPDTRNHQLPITVCVDMVNFNSSSRFADKEDNLLQFFLVHQAQGIEHFLVYDFDELSSRVVQLLQRTSLQIYRLPFNFPFLFKNTSAAHIRQFIETDCLLRNVNQARHTLLLTPNEFVYIDKKDNSIQRSLQQYTEPRYTLKTFAVCLDDRHKLLMDNTQYNAELQLPYSIFLYRILEPIGHLLSPPNNVNALLISDGLVHQYTDCQNIGDSLHDWRSTVRENFIKQLLVIRNEVDLLI